MTGVVLPSEIFIGNEQPIVVFVVIESLKLSVGCILFTVQLDYNCEEGKLKVWKSVQACDKKRKLELSKQI